mmetsp:Transcript_102112/g.289185  ORF Transcript_102112/g.289185 Transcript_102112/m.289185 type:complete len:245 (+) Transcript_102112:816-1550(+)
MQRQRADAAHGPAPLVEPRRRVEACLREKGPGRRVPLPAELVLDRPEDAVPRGPEGTQVLDQLHGKGPRDRGRPVPPERPVVSPPGEARAVRPAIPRPAAELDRVRVGEGPGVVREPRARLRPEPAVRPEALGDGVGEADGAPHPGHARPGRGHARPAGPGACEGGGLGPAGLQFHGGPGRGEHVGAADGEHCRHARLCLGTLQGAGESHQGRGAAGCSSGGRLVDRGRLRPAPLVPRAGGAAL